MSPPASLRSKSPDTGDPFLREQIWVANHSSIASHLLCRVLEDLVVAAVAPAFHSNTPAWHVQAILCRTVQVHLDISLINL
jgi:hypothetical protein